jgi:hypothetical protein
MKVVSFHLMPYRPLDLAEATKHRSPWVWCFQTTSTTR